MKHKRLFLDIVSVEEITNEALIKALSVLPNAYMKVYVANDVEDKGFMRYKK
jgi:hypothetical protein